ncbi:MAG TPA: chorismate synthase [Firmicutes bacterium]|nr:chorismate synthase [Bacillota bacterium]
MPSIWGEQLKISFFGESHGPAVGVVLDGLPTGQEIDLEQMETFMARRAPGRAPWSTARREDDRTRILSGIYQGRTCGTPLCAVIDNQDMRPEDYPERMCVPRPGHADYTGWKRYRGDNDPRGGGHFSGRLTAALCFAGAIAKQILSRCGITVAARILEIGGIPDQPLNPARVDEKELEQIGAKELPVADNNQGRKMVELIEAVRQEGDSLGGMIECFALGLPAGLGDPMFGGMKSRLASIVYGIPAVSGVSFGAGFAACSLRGSEHNDAFYVDQQGEVRTRTNRAGGINGGITNGMPLVLNVGIKPTSSIGKPQASIDLRTGEAKTLVSAGRHDPCIVPRAVPAVEAAVAVAVLDLLLVAYGVQGPIWTD